MSEKGRKLSCNVFDNKKKTDKYCFLTIIETTNINQPTTI